MTEAEWLASTDPTPMLEFLRGQASDRKLRLFACACCRRVWHQLKDPCFCQAVEVSEKFADGQASLAELAETSAMAADACDDIPKLDVMSPDNKHLDQWAFIDDEQGHFLSWLPAQATVFASCNPGMSIPAASGFGRGDYLFWVTNQVVWNVAQAAGWAITQADYATRRVYDSPEGEGVALQSGELPERHKLSHLLRDIFGNPFRPASVDPSWLVWNGGTVVKLAEAIYEDRSFVRLPALADALEKAGCHDADILGHFRQPGPHVRGCWVVDLLLGKG